MRLNICLAALAATTALAAPASAQSVTTSAQGEARGVVVQPLTLSKVDNLDFGTVISSPDAGTVSINADTGARTTTGGVTGVPNYPGNRGRFDGAGTAAQTVKLTLSPPSVLVSTTNPMDTITVTSMVLDSGNATTRTIGSTAVFSVGVGGEFSLAANQKSGLYRAQFDLTAEYQ